MERIKVGFTGSTNGLVNFTGNLAVFLAVMLPVLAYFLVIGGAGYLLYRALRGRGWLPNRRPTSPPGPPQPPQPPQPPTSE